MVLRCPHCGTFVRDVTPGSPCRRCGRPVDEVSEAALFGPATVPVRDRRVRGSATGGDRAGRSAAGEAGSARARRRKAVTPAWRAVPPHDAEASTPVNQIAAELQRLVDATPDRRSGRRRRAGVDDASAPPA